MKKIILFTGVLIALTGYYWQVYLDRTLIPIAVTFSENSFPLIKANIQGEKYPLELSLCSRYTLHICEQDLVKIQKIDKGMAHWKNIKGDEQCAPLFKIKNLQIDGLCLKDVLTSSNPADEVLSDSKGSFAWPFDKMNLLLDFPHHQICGVKNEKKLTSLGIDLSKMKKVKCICDEKGIRFESELSLGKCTLGLNTTCNVNAIKRSLWQGTKNQPTLKTNIKIGDKDFGQKKFSPFEFTSELELDGILGTDFLMQHIIYIDAQNQYLYIGDKHGNSLSKSLTLKVPVEFTKSGLPIIGIRIKGKIHKMIVDTGSAWEMILPSENFSTDSLKHLQTSESINFFGQASKVDSYSLSECRIGKAKLKNLISCKIENFQTKLSVKQSSLGTINSKGLGYIGWPLLNRTNLYFDLGNAELLLVKHQNDLKKAGICLEEFERIPFELEKCGLVIKVESDLGILRLMVDTGATGSLIKPGILSANPLSKDSWDNEHFLSNKFILGKSNFGKQPLYPLSIAPQFGQIDGVLGMDFLREHPFYIDYQNRLIYIRKLNKTSPQRIQY